MQIYAAVLIRDFPNCITLHTWQNKMAAVRSFVRLRPIFSASSLVRTDAVRWSYQKVRTMPLKCTFYLYVILCRGLK